MGKVYRFMKKYIGPVEVVIILFFMSIACYYLDYREKQQVREELLQELKAYTEENIRINEELGKKKEYKEPIVMRLIKGFVLLKKITICGWV